MVQDIKGISITEQWGRIWSGGLIWHGISIEQEMGAFLKLLEYIAMLFYHESSQNKLK